MKKFDKYRNWIIAFVFAVAVIAVYKTFDNFYKVAQIIGLFVKSLSPFVIGFVIAYILNIPATKIERLCNKSKYGFIKKRCKGISIISVYLATALLFYIAISAIAPALYRNFVDLYNNVPGYINEVLAGLEKLQKQYGFTLFEINEANIINAFNTFLGKIDITEFGKYAKGVINITSGVINTLIGIIVSVYMLIEKEKIKATLKRIARVLLKENKATKLVENVRKINNIFSKYLFCLLLAATIMAVLATIVLSILRVKYAIILGIMIGIFNLIPYFGAIIAGVLSVLITLLTGGFFQALWAAIALIILQQIDGNFTSPKIMGEVLDTSPLLVILAVTLGGGLFGISGMIISVPIVVTIKMALTEFIDEKEQENSED